MTRLIAEICSNHNGDLPRALALIEAAAAIGCDGAKFQLFRLDSLFTPELIAHPDYAFVKERRAWELPTRWLPDLAECCRQNKIEFGCTPFFLEAVDQLNPYVDFFKIASYEFLWYELATKILTETDKPLIMSCGMATLGEIEATVYFHTLQNSDLRNRLTLLHCISQYPARPEDCHLSFLDQLRGEFGQLAVGYSDHSVNPGVVLRAVHRYRAEVIEFHLDLDDKRGNEYQGGHCWTPTEIRPVILAIRDGLAADGAIGAYDPSQNPERNFRADPTDGLRPMRYMRE